MIFVSGGVRSGKSGVAERLAIQCKHPRGRLVYVACGKNTDAEMAERIHRHQQRRRLSGRQWMLIEASADIGKIAVRPNDTLLVDCVTTLLAGEYFREEKAQAEVHTRIVREITALQQAVHAVVAVSNDLSFEPPASSLTRDYMKKLGCIHQQLVEKSNTAILVEHGIPLVKKGGLSCVAL